MSLIPYTLNESNQIEVYAEPPEGFIPAIQVSGCAIEHEGEVLFLKRNNEDPELQVWSLPAGKLESGESPLEAVKREVLEETGIDISSASNIEWVGEIFVRKPGTDYIFHMYYLKVDAKPAVTLSQEHIDHQWISLAKAMQLPLIGAGRRTINYYRFWLRREKTARPNLCVYILLKSENQVLMMLRENTGHLDGQYSLPAGHVEKGESATASAIREVQEEVGVTIKAEDLCPVHFSHRDGDRDNMDIYFECSNWEGEVKNTEPHKCAGVEFFPIDRLPINTADYVRDVIEGIESGSVYSEEGWSSAT